MGITEFENSLIELIRARNPLLYVETFEEARVVGAVENIATNPKLKRDRQVISYTLSSGLHRLGEQGKPTDPVAAINEAAKYQEPTVFVFYDLHHFISASGAGSQVDPNVVRAVLDAARSFRSGAVAHTMILVSPGMTLPVDLQKEVTVLELPLPNREEIAAILDDIIQANSAQISVELTADDRDRLLQAAQGLTLGEAENAFARAIANDARLEPGDIALVLEEKRQTIRKSGLLEFVTVSEDIDDIGGLQNLKTWLRKRNGSWLPSAAGWGIPAPKGVLITGVPGCGKSLTAKCMASLWGLPLLRMDIGKVFSGLVGSSEQNMRDTLRLAEAVAPSILWIDEIEKGFGSNSGGDSGTSQRVFGTFLTWLQEKQAPVFVVATANKINALPPELLRKGRFDEIFFVDLPTYSEREEIWRIQLEHRLASAPEAAGEVSVEDSSLMERLARASNGFSGAEIAEGVVSACFDAYHERQPLREADLLRAISNTVPLATMQAEQIRAVRDWASQRAVAATAAEDEEEFAASTSGSADVTSWRGGRRIDF